MSTIVDHANRVSRDTFGDLESDTGRQDLSHTMPYMATPAAVATGALVTAAAFGAGYAAEEAADG